jgi:hypothetical protein
MPKKSSIPDTSAKIYKLLEQFEPEERSRIISGTLALFGSPAPLTPIAANPATPANQTQATGRASTASADPQQFFQQKDPQNKGESLAVAARYLENTSASTSHTKAHLEQATRGARRNFDSANFARDISNAVNQSGFFNKGGSAKKGYVLSYYGQNFVDALPDRKAAMAIQRPKRSGAKTRKTKETKNA